MRLRLALAIAVLSLCMSACSSGSVSNSRSDNSLLTDDEKHRLYSAALAASDSPMDTDMFQQVCRRIEIFDGNGKPNERYMAFVSRHVEWATSSETEEFRREINSKDKAREYIRRHLSAE